MNVLPMYFNMTRWSLGYAGTVWNDAVVDQYVDELVQATGVALPITSRRRLATVASDGLTWISQHVAGGCGVVGPLFSSPVGSQQGAAANNGATSFDQFRCVIRSVDGLPVAPHPLFSIIDSNAAHHLSALLAEYSFANTAPGTAKVVINFDAHPDFGVVNISGTIRCDNWGSYCVGEVGGRPAISDFYVGIGNKPTAGPVPPPAWSNSFVRVRAPHDRRKADVPAGTISAQIDSLANTIDAAAHLLNQGPWIARTAYVSVDRDVMQQSFTDYGDGHYDPTDARAGVLECLAALKRIGFTLSGFDVCGLPTVAGSSTAAPTLPRHDRTAIAFNDIRAFHEALLDW